MRKVNNEQCEVSIKPLEFSSWDGWGGDVLHQILGCHIRVDVCKGKTETRSYSKAFAEDEKSMQGLK